MAVGTQRGTAPLLGKDQLSRYSRQIILEEMGVTGQRRLLDSKVLVVGAGGLGSPVSLYLAAAGVGTLGIVDGDKVDLSNLHRQILHYTHDIGRPKTQSATRTLEDINPDVKVIPFQTTLTSENAMEIISQFDVVANGSDNFPTRYLVNDACVLLKKPMVDASILKWEGQATVFLPGRGCYRCLFPTPPPPGSVPSCAEGGVLGALAGYMGTLQAVETVKILLGVGDVLANRLLLFDALQGEVRTLRWKRNPDCPACGDHPTITQLIDYEEFCGLPGRTHAPDPPGTHPPASGRPAGAPRVGVPTDVLPEVDPDEAQRLIASGAQLIDVREPWEWAMAHIPGATLIPMAEVSQRTTEIDPNRPVVVHCAVGARSAKVVEALLQAGYRQVYNMAGGIMEWTNRQLPTEGGDGQR